MKQSIIITIEDGGMTVKADGFQGSACTEATKKIIAALGKKTEDTKTSAYFEHTTITNKQRA